MSLKNIAIALSVCALPFSAFAADPNAPVTRAELPALIKEALINDPDIMLQVMKKLRDKQAADSQKDFKQSIEKNRAELFNDTTSPSVGDAKTADVTLVEFFDYHCGYCKRQTPVITQLLNEDKKVRVVFREFPILSEDSNLAARAALAVHNIAKDKYFAFHTALMKSTGRFDEKMLLDLAEKEGVDSKKMKAEMERPEINAMLEKNRRMADDLGIRGTPAIVTGDQLVAGAMSYEDLKKLVEGIRANAGKPKS